MQNTRKKRGTSSASDKKREGLTMQQHVQQEAVRLSIEYELGPLKSEYGAWGTGHPLLAATVQLLSILFFCCLTYFLYSGFLQGLQAAPVFGNGDCCITRLSFSGDTDPHDSPIGLLIFFSCGGLVCSIWSCWNYWRKYPFRYSRQLLYEQGFLLIACRGKHIIGSEAMHWDEVGAIWYHFFYSSDSGTTDESYTLQYSDGAPFGNHVCKQKGKQSQPHNGPYWVKNSSGEYRFPPELGRAIEPLVLRSLIPRALEAYQQGLPVRFGLLNLHLGGVEYQGKLLPWQSLQYRYIPHDKQRTTGDALCFLEKGDQQSKRKKDWAWVASSEVPNFALLRHLVSSIAQSPPPISCIPLVAGRSATIAYSGGLATSSSSLTLHWGYNCWNHIVDTRMTKQHNGMWQATIMVPAEASVVNMAFFNQNDAWDNKSSDNYNLNVL